MKSNIGRTWIVGVLLGVLALPLYAAKHAGPGAAGGGPGMQQMSGMMHDMSGMMTDMWAQMEGAKLTPDQQKQMGERMK